MVDASNLNPFSNFDIGMGTFANVLIVIAIVTLILIGIAVLVLLIINKRRYKYKIPLYATVGNTPTRVANYKARDYPIGGAGDSLWYVAKMKKYLPPATIQTAPREYPHWEREDGEWINFGLTDLNDEQKKFNIKFIHQDMRSNRIAIDRLLESRFMKKSFWEKYGLIVSYILFFLVLTVAMVIIFYQFATVVEKMGLLVDKMVNFEKTQRESGLVPALIFTTLNLNTIKLGYKNCKSSLFC